MAHELCLSRCASPLPLLLAQIKVLLHRDEQARLMEAPAAEQAHRATWRSSAPGHHVVLTLGPEGGDFWRRF